MHLLNGGFTVQNTAKVFSAFTADQTNEQNNAMGKGDGSAVGLKENPAALRRWINSGPEVARLIADALQRIKKRKNARTCLSLRM